MASTTTEKTLEVLRSLFASYGLPEQLVSDNGPQFTAELFQEFCKQNGVKHIRCSPYHLASNGLAERFVRTFKEAMKAGAYMKVDLSASNCATSYRPTGVPRMVLLMNHRACFS